MLKKFSPLVIFLLAGAIIATVAAASTVIFQPSLIPGAASPSPTSASSPATVTQTLEQTSQQTSTVSSDGTTTATSSASVKIELLATDVEPDTTALDVLKNSGAQVELKSYGAAGSFITSINDLQGDAANYWALYINDEYAQTAADKTLVKDGDKITFTYERITTNAGQ
jgi:cytoskeletal protein RodZ